MNKISEILAASILTLSAGSVMAQVDLNATDGSAGPGGTVDVFVDLTGDGSTSTPSWRLLYPTSEVSAVDASQCDTSSPDISTDTSVNCSAGCGGFTPPAGFDCVSYILLPNNIVANTPVASTQFGPITFTIAGTASPGSTFDIVFGDTDLVGTTDPATIQVDVQPGESFFSSSPVPGSTIDFGSAVVGNPTSPDETVTVNNLSTDTTFDILSAAGNFGVGSGSYSVTSPATPATVATEGSVDVNANCTPGARGNNTGTFTITTDADNVTSAAYPTVCTGLSPNVQVPAGPVALSGTVAGADPSANITVTNPQDDFTSTANNVTATAGAGSTQITVTTGGPTNIAPNGSFDFAVSCDSSAEGVFSRTIDFAWTDPAGPGIDSIQVDCTVSDTAPIYNSDPVPGSLLSLATAANTQSAPDGLDINNANTNPAGDDLVISSATASDPVFNVNVINSSFAPNVGPDGSDDIEVTCTPPGVGTINGTLTVQTNDPNQPGGGFTYPLSCEGTGDALTTSPAAGGTLNLGTVPPGTTTGEGLISFTNNQIDGSINVDCSVTDTAGVFSFTPEPIQFTIPAGGTESAAFQCTPTDVSSFTADVSCTTPARGTTALNFTVSCAGRPLVIPTMSRWGLVVMSLVLLMVAGVAGRRMMA